MHCIWDLLNIKGWYCKTITHLKILICNLFSKYRIKAPLIFDQSQNTTQTKTSPQRENHYYKFSNRQIWWKYIFIPTKAYLNLVKYDHQYKQQTESAFMMVQKFAAMKEKADKDFLTSIALAADINIWYNNIGKKAYYRKLITHPDPKICARWIKWREINLGNFPRDFPKMTKL